MFRPIAVATFAVATVFSPRLLAQADDIQTGWAAWFNTTTLSERWSLVSDVQARSDDDAERLQNFLARGGVSYAPAKGITLAAGYAYIETNFSRGPTATEQRGWQQLVIQERYSTVLLVQRLRLEQRFLERQDGTDFYSDRLRYFVRGQLPLDGDTSFGRGTYAAVQNETFLNLSNRDDLNGVLFDQNRAYLGIGWRFSPSLDLEIGYLNQFIERRGLDTMNHVLQLSAYTRF